MERDSERHQVGGRIEVPDKRVSKEKRSEGVTLYSPRAMNKAIDEGFSKHGWGERRISYWVTSNAKLVRKTLFMDAAQQKAEIEGAGL